MVLPISFLGFLFLPFALYAATLEIDPATSQANFLAIGRPSMMKIHGKDGKLQGKLDFDKKENLGEILVDLDSFDTGIQMRNQHMREKYLQTGTPSNKFAKLVIAKFALSSELIKAGGKTEAPFTGKLNLHGVDQDIAGTLITEIQGESFSGSSKFQIKLSDYKIDIPSYLGVKVAETVDVDVLIKGKIRQTAKQ